MLVFIMFPFLSFGQSTFISDMPKYALLVGINDYDHLPKLANAESDVEDMKEVLIKKFGFPPNNLKFLRANRQQKKLF